MGMTLRYRRVSLATLEVLKANPGAIPEFMLPMEGFRTADGASVAIPSGMREMLEAMPEEQREQLLGQLAAFQGEALGFAEKLGKDDLAEKLAARFDPPHEGSASETLSTIPDEPPLLDIDKTWHALHYLLCQDVWEGEAPLKNVVFGGQEIGEDEGYGPARYLVPEQVVEVATALGELTREELVARCSAADEKRDDLDPAVWSNDESEWILDVFDQVKAYFDEAARAGQAMFVLMC